MLSGIDKIGETMITTEILQTIPQLPQADSSQIAETFLMRLQTAIAIPIREQINQQLKIAALLAVDDYANDSELTAFTPLDGEDFYEYE
jgi:hypothetical protein